MCFLKLGARLHGRGAGLGAGPQGGHRQAARRHRCVLFAHVYVYVYMYASLRVCDSPSHDCWTLHRDDHQLSHPHINASPATMTTTAIEADERDFQLYASGVLTAE